MMRLLEIIRSWHSLSLICLLTLSSPHAGALVSGPYDVSGKVKSFNEQTVVIETEQATLEIPREFVGVMKLAAGVEVHLALSAKQAQKVKAKVKRKTA